MDKDPLGYADRLRQQAQWIDEARDRIGSPTQWITLDDIDTDEMRDAADEIERLSSAITSGLHEK
jgi:hypothetical protein